MICSSREDLNFLKSKETKKWFLVRNFKQFFYRMKSFEMQPPTSMRRAFSMDTNYASLETASSMPPMNNTTNGHSHSYVDTEVSSNKMNNMNMYRCIRKYFRMFSLGWENTKSCSITFWSDCQQKPICNNDWSFPLCQSAWKSLKSLILSLQTFTLQSCFAAMKSSCESKQK